MHAQQGVQLLVKLRSWPSFCDCNRASSPGHMRPSSVSRIKPADDRQGGGRSFNGFYADFCIGAGTVSSRLNSSSAPFRRENPLGGKNLSRTYFIGWLKWVLLLRRSRCIALQAMGRQVRTLRRYQTMQKRSYVNLIPTQFAAYPAPRALPSVSHSSHDWNTLARVTPGHLSISCQPVREGSLYPNEPVEVWSIRVGGGPANGVRRAVTACGRLPQPENSMPICSGFS